MPRPRSSQISLSDTPYYHCISRCVRRSYLCGKDDKSGQDYEHRRDWVEQRMLFLASVYAIDVCAYAVMSNHTHIVLHVNQDLAVYWSVKDVFQRWHRIHRGTLLSQQYMNGELNQIDDVTNQTLKELARIYRKRLMDISWFMRDLNEYIARRANTEDDCSGRFWEGRFKSQALLDKAAIATCMAYVDLNPVRANMANTLEDCDYTSIQLRLISKADSSRLPLGMAGFSNTVKSSDSTCEKSSTAVTLNTNSRLNTHRHQLPFDYDCYAKLVYVTGKVTRAGKPTDGCLKELDGALDGFHISPEAFIVLASNFESHGGFAMGHSDNLKRYSKNVGMQRCTGLSTALQLLPT